MAYSYASDTLSSRMTAIAAAIDAGGTSGKIKLLDGSGNIYSQMALSYPCGTVSNGVLTFTTPIVDPYIVSAGTVTTAEITDSNGNIIVSGLTVGTVGTDIILNTIVLIQGQDVQIDSLTLSESNVGYFWSICADFTTGAYFPP